MSFIPISIMSQIHPAIYIAALLPFLFSIIMGGLFYFRFDVGVLGVKTKAFNILKEVAEGISTCKKDNVIAFNKALLNPECDFLRNEWHVMVNKLEYVYKGDLIPFVETFFDFEGLVYGKKNRRIAEDYSKIFWIVSALIIILPSLVGLFIYPLDYTTYIDSIEFTQTVMVSAITISLLFIIYILFFFVDHKAEVKVRVSYEAFCFEFNRIIPTEKPEVAILIETAVRQRDSFDAAAKSIVDKFDTVVEEIMVPVIKNTVKDLMKEYLEPALTGINKTLSHNLDKSFELQKDGVEKMANVYSESLSSSIKVHFTDLSQNIGEINNRMSSFNEKLEGSIVGLSGLLEVQREAFERSNKMLSEVGAYQSNILSEAKELQRLTFENGTVLNENISKLKETIDKSAEESKEINRESLRLNKEANEVQLKFIQETTDSQIDFAKKTTENQVSFAREVSESQTSLAREVSENQTAFAREVKESQINLAKENSDNHLKMVEDLKNSQTSMKEAMNSCLVQYDNMSKMVTEMMDNITEQMDKAMSNAGREIAQGIKDVTADNADAIEKLTMEAAKLREDYDTYFGRLSDNTKATLDEMDYHMQSITTMIIEDVGKMLKESTEANGDILSQYKDNTTDILQSFGEQALSISLYAKEINMDISELANSLKDSVSQFTESIQGGVHTTLTEFDTGLAELAKRISNTVESISDAVEALPAAIRK